MKCPFCHQWNGPRLVVCGFCFNPLGAEEDETLDGRPGYERSTKVEIPVLARPPEGAPPYDPDKLSIKLERLLRFIFS